MTRQQDNKAITKQHQGSYQACHAMPLDGLDGQTHVNKDPTDTCTGTTYEKQVQGPPGTRPYGGSMGWIRGKTGGLLREKDQIEMKRESNKLIFLDRRRKKKEETERMHTRERLMICSGDSRV